MAQAPCPVSGSRTQKSERSCKTKNAQTGVLSRSIWYNNADKEEKKNDNTTDAQNLAMAPF